MEDGPSNNASCFRRLTECFLSPTEEGLTGSSAESQRRLLAWSVDGGADSEAPEETLLRRRVRGRGPWSCCGHRASASQARSSPCPGLQILRQKCGSA
ncbi:hypothetical protein G4228_016676 [Cervus hanglu yarkandensis]|nr:hypothetical protein G4228_016676 [Cervus hanglu yarkandensis]